MPHPARNTQTVSNAKLPDALRLSDLRELCNVLNLRAFVGRIRRLRHIRHETYKNPKAALCGVFSAYHRELIPLRNLSVK